MAEDGLLNATELKTVDKAGKSIESKSLSSVVCHFTSGMHQLSVSGLSNSDWKHMICYSQNGSRVALSSFSTKCISLQLLKALDSKLPSLTNVILVM